MKRSRGSRHEPDRFWRVGNRVGGAATVFGGIAGVAAGMQDSLWPLVACGLVMIVVAIWWWLRVPRASVEYDSAGVTVVGLFWTRRIDRHAIQAVGPDLDWPMIGWRDERGRLRVTILTPIATGGGWHGILLVPERSLDERRKFLRRLQRWAGSD